MSRSIYRDLFFLLNLHQKQLTPKAVQVFLTYVCHHGKEGAWPSLTTLQKHTGLSRTAVSNAKKMLAKFPDLIEFHPQAGGKPDLAIIPLLADHVVVSDYQVSGGSPEQLVAQTGKHGSPRLPEIGLEIIKNQEDNNADRAAGSSLELPPIGKESARVIPFERFANKKKGVSGSG